MEAKKSNLCLSADVTTTAELLALADKTGPYICMLKTHCDIVDDWSSATAAGLDELARKHNFVIFEDRKFADIGNTVVKQFTGGVFRIGSWSDCVNVHILPGPAVIETFKAPFASGTRCQGLILLAEMSSQGNFLTPEYSSQALALATKNSEIVFGLSQYTSWLAPNHALQVLLHSTSSETSPWMSLST
jgi:orotidine 5'-phosphate decarboxylase subfamily 1